MNLKEALAKGRSFGWRWTVVTVHGVEFTVFYEFVEADPQNGVEEVKEPKLIYHNSDEMYDFLDAGFAAKIVDQLQETPHYFTPEVKAV